MEEAESNNKFSFKPKFVSKYQAFCLLNEFSEYGVNRFMVCPSEIRFNRHVPFTSLPFSNKAI